MNSTRILAIAPYEGFREVLMKAVSIRETEVRVSMYLGDLQEGLAIAQEANLNDYDIVLSRGGTAELLRSNLPLPVVSMDPSVLDVLRCIRIVRNTKQKYVIVAFPAIAEIARKLFALIDQDEEIYVVHSSSEAYETVHELKTSGCEAVIGDAVAVAAAEENGLNAFLITSGEESAQAALSEAIRLKTMLAGAAKNSFALRHILDSAPLFVVVFDWNGQVFYSNGFGNITDHGFLLKYARETIPELTSNEEVTKYIRMDSILWHMKGLRLVSENLYVFYIEKKNTFAFDKKNAMQFLASEWEEPHSFIDQIGQMKELTRKAQELFQKNVPLLICGENGTPVEEMMHNLCRSGKMRYQSILWIDCEKMDDSYLHRLLESEDSPLMDNGVTICFHHISAFPSKMRREYFEYVKLTRLHSRCRLLYSTDEDPGKDWWNFLSGCGCGILQIPPLRSRKEDIPALANLYLSEWNYATGRQVLGLEPEASRLLQQYHWPENNAQLRSAVRQALIAQDGEMLTAAGLLSALRSDSLPSHAEDRSSVLLTEGKLDDIISRAARLVLEEEGGNHQKAAGRLGISRTTLWRLLKS